MGIAISLFVLFAGFSAMSKAFRGLVTLVFVSSLAYGYSVSYHVNGIGPNFPQTKALLNLYSLNIGLFCLGVILGIIRHSSSSNESYLARRATLFKFLMKWGAIYAVYSFVGGEIINAISGDDSAGFFVMKFYGAYGFFILLIIFYAARYKFRKTMRVQSPP